MGRAFGHFAGELSASKCKAYCSCNSFNYAGIDESFCWCGNSEGEACSGDNDCFTKEIASGFVAGFEVTPLTRVQFLTNFSLNITPVANVNKYGVVVNGKLSEYNDSMVIISLVQLNNTIIVEPEAFWGCQSDPHTIETYIPASLSLDCDRNVVLDGEVECHASVGGTSLQNISWISNEGETSLSIHVSYPADPYYYSVGGNMETNRFEDYWESYDWSNNVNTAFINPNHEFTSEGTVKAFEAYITRMDGEYSCVKFMILKPVCLLAENKYCVLEKSCQPVATLCGEDLYDITSVYDIYTRPVYAMTSGRFAVSKEYNVPNLVEVSSLLADYKVLYVFTGTATHLGNNIFVVPDDHSFKVKPGYILGWLPCKENPADIGYYPIDPIYESIFPEYEYPEVFSTYNGAIFDRAVDYFKVSNYMHMLRAYVLSPTNYLETFTAAGNPGDTINIETELISVDNVTLTSNDICIITEKIGNLTISSDDAVYAGVELTLTFLLTNGSGEMYCINWDDGFGPDADKKCSIKVENKTVTHVWKLPGVYSVFVEAYNMFSVENTTKEINVLGSITDVSFVENIGPVPTSELLIIDFKAVGSGGVDFSIDYLTNETVNTMFNGTLSSYFIAHVERALPIAYDVLCNVTVHHPLQSKHISAYGSVEDPVGIFELQTNETGATYNQTTFKIYEHIGTNVSYYWDWGDGETDNHTYIREANHTYMNYGNWTVTITAYNQVSIRTLEFVYTIQDTIQGLSFFGTSHYYAEHDKNASIVYRLNNGTGVRTWIEYNTTLISPLGFDIDIETNDSSMLAHGIYVYLNRGFYNVTVHCENNVSSAMIWYYMPVESRISEYQVNLTQAETGGLLNINGNATLDFIELNETLTLYASYVLGGDVVFNYILGDGRNFTTRNRSYTFTYPYWSENGSFPVVITATNVIEQINKTMMVYVEMPVEILLGFEILHSAENSTEEMNMTLAIQSGDYFNCTWDFGDNTSRLISYDHFLENYGTVLKQYPATDDPLVPGVYNVSINCSSRLYYGNASAVVYSYNPVSEFVVDLFYECEGKNRSKGKGDREDLFPITCYIIFKVSDQTGTNVSYHFDFGYTDENDRPVETITYNNSETKHLFQFEKKATKDSFPMTVKINASNVVSWVEVVKVVLVITELKNVTVKGDGKDTMVGQLANISVRVETMAYQGCYVIEFGSDSAETIVFGDESCPSDDRFAFFKYVGGVKLAPLQFKKVYSHAYYSQNLYTVTLRAYNPVSELVTTTTIKVVDFPCNPPTASWASAMGDNINEASIKAPFFKCMRYSVLTKAIPDCQKPNATLRRSWLLQHVYNNEGRPGDGPIPEMPGYEDGLFVIEKRLLNYGIYYIEFNASMYHNTTGVPEQIPETESSISGYFNITKCPLVADIAGGTGRAVGHDGKLVLDASQSHDPDMEWGTEMDLTFEWYCKRNNKDLKGVALEEFNPILANSDKVRYPKAPDPSTTNDSLPRDNFIGCFGSKIGILDGADFTNRPIIKIEKRFMLYSQSYDIKFRLTKPNRKSQTVDFDLKVLLEEPPIVAIKCKLNCLQKAIVVFKTSLLAACENCNGRTPYYRWEMYQKKIGSNSPEEEFKNITLELKNYATTDITSEKNLVIKSGSFKEGYDYKVKLFSSWSPNTKFNPNKIGFSQYTVEINTAPIVTAASCETHNDLDKEITTATSLETKVKISCNGVIDADIPLTYKWFYRRVRNVSEEVLDTEWKPASSPSSGSSMSDLFFLPPGDKEMGQQINIKVTVTDVFGATSEPIFTKSLKVIAKAMKNDQIDDILNDPGVLNDPGLMSNVINSMLDSMDSFDGVNPNKLISQMIKMVSSLPLDSAWSCVMAAETQDSITKKHYDLGLRDTDSATALKQNLITTQNIARCSEYLPIRELEKATFHTLTSSARYTGDLIGNDSSTNLQWAMRSEMILSTTTASTMISGEPPLAMHYNNDDYVKLSCVDPKVAREKKFDLGGFTIPKNANEGGSKECIGVINTKGKNRYTFDVTSTSVYGKTYGMSLSPGRKMIKEIKNLTDDLVRLVMPMNDKLPSPEYHTAYCELVREVHLLDCKVNSTAMMIKTVPVNKSFDGNIFIFINKGFAPSLVSHDINCTLPNPYPANWTDLSWEEQQHFESEDKWRCFITEDQMDRKCLGRWVAGVVYYTNSTNHTEYIKSRELSLTKASCPPLNYTFMFYSRACLFYDEETEMWSGKGCNASRETKDNETVCYCNHLTDFGGGGPFKEPNPIDFSAAFAGFASLGDNPTVFSIVMVILLLYLIALLIARRKDKIDAQKRIVYPLDDNHPNDNYYYEVSIQTGFDMNAATTADVFIILQGSENELAPKKLHNPNRTCFNRGEIDYFLIAAPRSVGRLESVELWHNNAGESPGWYLQQVQVRDVQRDVTSIFVCEKWLDVAEDDNSIIRTVPLARKEDLVEFSYVFCNTIRRDIYDGHIWLSVFTKQAQSTYTTVQRLSTCLSLLLMFMLCNAMFYNVDNLPPPAEVYRIGPLKISIDQVRIGFSTAVIIIPIHLLIVLLFKTASPKPDKNAQKYGPEEATEVTPTDAEKGNVTPVKATPVKAEPPQKEVARKKHNAALRFLQFILFSGRADENQKRPLPYWTLYIAYVLVFLTTMVSALFVMLYGFSFGKDISEKWVVTLLVSLFESFFLFQPIKVLILSIIFAVFIKEPERNLQHIEQYVLDGKLPKARELTEEEEEEKKMEFRLPNEKRQEEARHQRMKEKVLKAMVREIIVHLAYVVLASVVCYAAVDPNSYQLYEGIQKLMIDNGVTREYFNNKAYMLEDIEPDGKTKRDVKPAMEVSNRLDWFDWARYSVIEYLFPTGWYNGNKDYKAGFVADNEASKILAMARFRMLRAKNMSCTKHEVFEHLIRLCIAGYSTAVEDTETYNTGWRPLNPNSTAQEIERKAFRKNKREAMYLGLENPWQHQSSAELNNFPLFAKFGTYSGGSYSVSIGPTKKVAKKIVRNMKDHFWIDRFTRAIILEANIYNANTNLMLMVTFAHEILATGGWEYFSNVKAIRLYRYVGGVPNLILLFDFIFVFVTFVGLYKMIRGIKRNGCANYLSDFWNLLHTIVTCSALGAICLTFGRLFAVKSAVYTYSQEPEKFVSFSMVDQMENFVMAFLGFVLFFTNLEYLRIMRFNKSIANMTKTMKILGTPLMSFGMTFIIIFMAYVSFCHCIFADKLRDFNSVKTSFVALTNMFMGSFDIYAYLDNAPIFGPIMFFSYMLAIQMIMINMFVGIICDAFAEVGEQEDNEEKPSVLSFMANRVKSLAAPKGAMTSSGVDPIYSDWKDEWDVMMEEFEERADNCVYLMRNFEGEEIRQIKWFSDEEADIRKKNALTAILGTDFYVYDSEFCDGLHALETKLRNMSPAETTVFLKAASIKRKEEREELERMENEAEMSDVSEDDDDDEIED